jgi:hypothetical protein
VCSVYFGFDLPFLGGTAGRLGEPSQSRTSAGLPLRFRPVGLRKKLEFLVTIWRRLFFVEVVRDGIMHHHAGQKGAQSETYVMKPHQKRLLGFLTLLTLLAVPHLASAYYDPGVQRWINRDPMEEDGGLNLYADVLNDPIDRYDVLGLEGKPQPPKWDPGAWSGREENSCCNYAYDRPGPPYRLYPGELGGMPDFSYKNGSVTCDEIARRTKADFPNNPNVGPPKGGKCPAGTHNTKAWIDADGVGWHMQRQDDDGKWSEKPDALTKPQRCSPKKAQGYKTECPQICVPDAARY